MAWLYAPPGQAWHPQEKASVCPPQGQRRRQEPGQVLCIGRGTPGGISPGGWGNEGAWLQGYLFKPVSKHWQKGSQNPILCWEKRMGLEKGMGLLHLPKDYSRKQGRDRGVTGLTEFNGWPVSNQRKILKLKPRNKPQVLNWRGHLVLGKPRFSQMVEKNHSRWGWQIHLVKFSVLGSPQDICIPYLMDSLHRLKIDFLEDGM